MVLERGRFRVRGDTLEVQPADAELAYRISMFGDEVESITEFDPLTGEVLDTPRHLAIYPATHYITPPETIDRALRDIRDELEEQLRTFEAAGKLVEAHRLRQRTEYDMEMIRELGFCSGIENYSRILDGRAPGEPPHTLLDFFPDDFLCFIDESHNTMGQLRGMYEGDRSRKLALIDAGFRLPSALDNRPLQLPEFLDRVGQLVFVSATPGDFERRASENVVEQIIRPTGLVDPEVDVRPTHHQIDDLLGEIRARADRDERALVTTLTKKMAEDLTEYLLEAGVRARYLHSEIDTLERIRIVRALRLGEFDVLVGVNLLREGLDLPEVTLVAILDADKEGFLRGTTSLIQTIGRAARNVDGSGDHVRRPRDRGHADRHRRDQPAPRDPAGLQRGARDHARVDHQGRLGHRRVPGPGRRAGAPRRPRRGEVDALADVAPDELERMVIDREQEMFVAAEELQASSWRRACATRSPTCGARSWSARAVPRRRTPTRATGAPPCPPRPRAGPEEAAGGDGRRPRGHRLPIPGGAGARGGRHLRGVVRPARARPVLGGRLARGDRPRGRALERGVRAPAAPRGAPREVARRGGRGAAVARLGGAHQRSQRAKPSTGLRGPGLKSVPSVWASGIRATCETSSKGMPSTSAASRS